MAQDFLPRQDQAFFQWAKSFGEKIALDPEHYQISAEQVSLYQSDFAAFQVALTRATDPTMRTKPAVTAKNACRRALESNARSLVARIRAVKSLNPAERIALGMNPRNSGGRVTRIGVPESRPVLIVDAARGRLITLAVRDSETSSRG